MSDRTRILIAGGGLGGLALAQALRHGGLDVAVYEQDPTPKTRNQGYRIHLDANGNAALRNCLPPDVHAAVRRTSGVSNDLMAGYTHRLERQMAQTFPVNDDITHVDRNAFRQALLTGLTDNVHFGRTVSEYEITDRGRVRVKFTDGDEDEGDLLIGADGVGSAVRAQLLPYASVKTLDLRCLYGRMTIDETTHALIPEDFHRGFCWVADEEGCGAGFAPMRFRTRPEGVSDYLMTTVVATSERLAIPDEELFELSPEQLRKATLRLTADWHPKLQELFTRADAFFPIKIRASERVDPWRPGPVTLLGDAIHTMPPTGGVGANTALQDAATLAHELLHEDQPLTDAVAAYERAMLPRGFNTVTNSMMMADQLFTRT